jgi:hypothetical protein
VKECTHGFPSPASCWECMLDYGQGADPKVRDEVAATFAAKYDGDCHECDLPISAGQTIHKLEPSGRYVHVGCWNVAL